MRHSIPTAARLLAVLACVAAFTAPSLYASPIAQSQVVAIGDGHDTPTLPTHFGTLHDPVINNHGQVIFNAYFYDDNNLVSAEGIYRHGGSSDDGHKITRDGDDAPGLDGYYINYDDVFGPAAFNDQNQAVFSSALYRTDGRTDGDYAIFRSHFPVQVGGTTIYPTVPVLQKDEDAPDNAGTYYQLGQPAINNAGHAAFVVNIDDGSRPGTPPSNYSIVRTDGKGGISTVVSDGQTAPDGHSKFTGSYFKDADGFVDAGFNDADQVAFHGVFDINTTSDSYSDDEGVYLADPDQGLIEIARKGHAAGSGSGTFTGFSAVGLNDQGQVVFNASTTGAYPGGLYRGDATHDLTRIATLNGGAPGSQRTFIGFSAPVLNNAGQVAFSADLSAGFTSYRESEGIFREDGDYHNSIQIVHDGQAAPDHNGVFDNTNDQSVSIAMNDAGQVAFIADLINTAGGDADDAGIFLYDDALGLIQIAREGDHLLGSTITHLSFDGSTGYYPFHSDMRTGLNDLGQVAYGFELADGRSGIAVSTIPEPASVMLFGLGTVLLLRRRTNQKPGSPFHIT